MRLLDTKYVGDAALRRFLKRYHCPQPFHVVRMRFWGEISSPIMDTSPIKTIQSFWPDGLPEFDNEQEFTRFFETLMGLWNRMSRFQGPDKKVLLKKLPRLDPVNSEVLASALTCRHEELVAGFLEGFFGGGAEADVPDDVAPLLEHLEHGIEIIGRMESTVIERQDTDDPRMIPGIAQAFQDMDPIIHQSLNDISEAVRRWRKEQLDRETDVPRERTIH